PGGEKRKRRGRPFDERPRIAQGNDVPGAGACEFTKASLRMFGGKAKLCAARVITAKALGALPASLVRSDHDPLADRKVRYGRASPGDFANDLAAADVRHGNLEGQPLPDPQIEMIHP